MGPKIKLTGCPANLSDKIDTGNGLKVKRINTKRVTLQFWKSLRMIWKYLENTNTMFLIDF